MQWTNTVTVFVFRLEIFPTRVCAPSVIESYRDLFCRRVSMLARVTRAKVSLYFCFTLLNLRIKVIFFAKNTLTF